MRNIVSKSRGSEATRGYSSRPTDYPEFSISDDLIIFKGTLWLDSQNPFIPALLHEYHATPLGGHFGVKKTLHRLQPNF